MQLDSFPSITFSMMSLHNWRNPLIASQFFDIINNAGKEFIPTKYAECHPYNLSYDPSNKQDVIDFWMNEDGNGKMAIEPEPLALGNIILKNGKKVSYSIKWSKSDYGDFNYFIFSVDINLLRIPKNLNRFYDLCTKFIELLVPVQGSIVNDSIPHFTEPKNLKVIHPKLQWGNIFGAPYVRLFGKEKLLSSPAYQTVELLHNVVFVQLSQDIFTKVEDEQRLIVNNHLNPRAFVENGSESTYIDYVEKDTIVPEFEYAGVLYDPNKAIRKRQILRRTRT